MDSNENITETTDKSSSKGPFMGIRHLQAILLFLNVSVLFSLRVHGSITLVAMTNADKANTDFPEYHWNEKQKSYILSSFYWGFFITQFPGAYFSRQYGVKISLFLYTLLTGLLTLAVPFCVPWGGWQSFCTINFLIGLSQGGAYPAFLQHLANWSPPGERELLSGFAHTGYELGLIFAMIFSGFIAKSSFGWPGIFYTFAAFCFIWCAVWLIFGANNINSTKFVTAAEKFYIETSLENSLDFNRSRLPVPWRAIFTSKPFYALLVVRAASQISSVTAEIEWPTYINSILGLDIEKNAVYSTLPALVSWLSAFVFIFISNFITKRNLLSLTLKRKCLNSFGMWLPALGLILIGFLGPSYKYVVIITMIFVLAAHNGVFIGSYLSFIDMAPNHTDIIVSIANMFSCFAIMLGPLIVGIIVNDEYNQLQWRTAFIVFAAIFCIGDVIFLIWGTAKEQPWNAVDFLKKNESEAPKSVEQNIEITKL